MASVDPLIPLFVVSEGNGGDAVGLVPSIGLALAGRVSGGFTVGARLCPGGV